MLTEPFPALALKRREKERDSLPPAVKAGASTPISHRSHAATASANRFAHQGRNPLSTLYQFPIAKAKKKRYSNLICECLDFGVCESGRLKSANWQLAKEKLLAAESAFQEAPVHDGGFGLSQLNMCNDSSSGALRQPGPGSARVFVLSIQ